MRLDRGNSGVLRFCCDAGDSTQDLVLAGEHSATATEILPRVWPGLHWNS